MIPNKNGIADLKDLLEIHKASQAPTLEAMDLLILLALDYSHK